MRFVVMLLGLAGCMAEPGNCSETPGNCPSEGPSTGSTPVFHRYVSPHAVAEGDHLRVVMTSAEETDHRAETLTLRPGEAPTEIVPLTTRDGAEIEGAPQLSRIGDRVLASWFSQTDRHVALLGADGVLATTPVSLGTFSSGHMVVRRAGERWLAVHVSAFEDQISGTWIRQDGAVDGTTVLATSVAAFADVTDDLTGAAPVVAIAFFRENADVRELRVVRFGIDGTRLDEDSLLVARDTSERSLASASAGAAVDGSVLVLYQTVDRQLDRRLQAVRIESDGAMAETTIPAIATNIYDTPKLMTRQTHYFATLTRDDGADSNTTFTQMLDLDGQPLAPANATLTTRWAYPVVIATDDSYAFLHSENDIAVTFVAADGSPQGTTIVATDHEIDTGCHAGVSSGAGAMLALLGIRRRRRRRS